MEGCVKGNLHEKKVEFHSDLVATSVVAASGGYIQSPLTFKSTQMLTHPTGIQEIMRKGSKFTG